MQNNTRYTNGIEKLNEVDGEAGQKVYDSLNDICPDLATYMVEFVFGDIYNRTKTDLKTKELAVVAALTSMGNAIPQLKVHINGALNVGCTISDIKEVIIQMSVYAGFPTSLNGLFALKDVLEERKIKGIRDPKGNDPTAHPDQPSRLERGKIKLSEYHPLQLQQLEESLGEISPDLVRFTVEYGYGDISSRDNLNPQLRQIATIAALTSMGTAAPQLKFHIKAALNLGVAEETIKETILLMVCYAGFPRTLNGMFILKEVLNER